MFLFVNVLCFWIGILVVFVVDTTIPVFINAFVVELKIMISGYLQILLHSELS